MKNIFTMRFLLNLACCALPLTAAAQSNVGASPDAQTFSRREADWRNGAVVYQVLVDRFAPSRNLQAKKALYPPPKVLRRWDETAQPGVYLEEAKLNSAELDFWGGDLQSLTDRLGHIEQLGANVLYLNPIHLAYTNHKYDALDFKQISPEFGNRADFRQLVKEVHGRGMKLVLDGVFNHMGRNAPRFQDALNNSSSRWRNWFAIGPEYAGGARSWTGFQNLPELNLENPAVRKYLYEAPDSVVRTYLREGADGWRLDTAFELGPTYLRGLTQAAHQEKPGSLVVGEIVQYPGAWLAHMDAVMNYTLRQILLGLARGELAAARSAGMIERLIQDAGIEPMLKSWIVIDNHDNRRIATELPAVAQRRMLQTLQFTLPGAPNIYYGAELGMVGGGDPENRSPMRWDLLRDDNPELIWMKQLVRMHKQQRALRIGNFRRVDSQQLLAFERTTDRALETVIVLANPGNTEVRERLMIANPWLMDVTPMVNLIDPERRVIAEVDAGMLTVTVPPVTTLVLVPQEKSLGGYSRYKRVP